MAEKSQQNFAIFAEAEGHDKPLLMIRLSFGRLIDEVVLPYESDKPFFIDGVPVARAKLKKLKILRTGQGFEEMFYHLNDFMNHHGDEKVLRTFGEQYDKRVEAILRDAGEDVTAQVINAYGKTIGEKIKDYLPRREELIQAAFQLFTNTLGQLANAK